MPVKNKTIEDYVFGRCNAQQMEELLAWAKGANKRMRWLFDDKAIVDIAEERLFKAIAEGQGT